MKVLTGWRMTLSRDAATVIFPQQPMRTFPLDPGVHLETQVDITFTKRRRWRRYYPPICTERAASLASPSPCLLVNEKVYCFLNPRGFPPHTWTARPELRSGDHEPRRRQRV